MDGKLNELHLQVKFYLIMKPSLKNEEGTLFAGFPYITWDAKTSSFQLTNEAKVTDNTKRWFVYKHEAADYLKAHPDMIMMVFEMPLNFGFMIGLHEDSGTLTEAKTPT